ncbi:MAG: enoyl-CoA hydratase/isomerase family protein, partial [Candidatus Bipolaricaulis sp.]|nr:enoyl-CoA hydratase/isomerase family protein [Candidatus Bipolaricaulis sp.]
LDSETIAELRRHLEATEKTDARAVVYRGAGGTHFIGGADGVEMYEMAPDGARQFSRRIQELFTRMESSPLYLIAAIDGLCFGGGLEFALACDLRLASETARLGLPEVKLGIIPGGGGTQRLPRVVGFGRSVEMVLGGRLVASDEALRIGLITAVVPAAELEERAAEVARRIAAIPPHALAAAKRAVYASRDLPLAQGLSLEADRFAECFKESYFADRVREQLADGRLTTTRERTQEGKAGKHADA